MRLYLRVNGVIEGVNETDEDLRLVKLEDGQKQPLKQSENYVGYYGF